MTLAIFTAASWIILMSHVIFAPLALAGPVQINPCAGPNEALTQAQKEWREKAFEKLRQVKPGLKRKDLLKLVTSEGGFYTRFQRIYVHVGCPYIKVNIRFRAINSGSWESKENPEDIVESVSEPFLAPMVID